MTLRVYGAPERFELAESVSGGPPASLAEAAPGIAAAEFEVGASGSVTLRQGGATLGAWSFTMEPDAAPTIAMIGALERAPSGETRLGYQAKDDHGIMGARAEIALDLDRVDRRYGLAVEPEPRPALVAELPMPLNGSNRDVAETLVEDFSKHPFAGMPVTVRLAAEDAKGQTGASASVEAVLPMRRFYDPLAQALIEQRRDLLWSSANGGRVTRVLRAVTHRPEDVFDNPRAYLVARTAIRRLAAAVDDDQVPAVRDEIAEALWQAAVQIEDGNLGDAAARLARAKERLQQALRGDATDEEIAQLMDELRQATREYMEEMARQALENGEMQQAEIPPGQMVTQDQIQELMDRIQELSEQGRKAEAEALLEMLQQMLENMQMMMGQGQGQGQGGEGQQSMQGLADALREQQGLADDSFQELQRQFREGRPGGEGQDQSGQGRGGDQGQMLAERQEALRELMEELQRGLPGAAGEAAREALRDAERSMGEARDGLEQGDTSGALDDQAEAIDNLREGMRQMGEDLRRAEGSPGEGDQGQVGGEFDRRERPRSARPADRLARERRQQRADAARGRQRGAGARAARRDPPPRRRAAAAAARARLSPAATRPVLTAARRSGSRSARGARRRGGRSVRGRARRRESRRRAARDRRRPRAPGRRSPARRGGLAGRGCAGAAPARAAAAPARRRSRGVRGATSGAAAATIAGRGTLGRSAGFAGPEGGTSGRGSGGGAGSGTATGRGRAVSVSRRSRIWSSLNARARPPACPRTNQRVWQAVHCTWRPAAGTMPSGTSYSAPQLGQVRRIATSNRLPPGSSDDPLAFQAAGPPLRRAAGAV